MLALATTRATVTGRKPGDQVARDAHGAPKPQAPTDRGPYAAHRRGDVPVLLDDGREVRGATWYLEPEAWPVASGDTIVDANDGTRWSVEGAQLVPAGLGLQHVTASCTQAQPQVAT